MIFFFQFLYVFHWFLDDFLQSLNDFVEKFCYKSMWLQENFFLEKFSINYLLSTQISFSIKFISYYMTHMWFIIINQYLHCSIFTLIVNKITSVFQSIIASGRNSGVKEITLHNPQMTELSSCSNCEYDSARFSPPCVSAAELQVYGRNISDVKVIGLYIWVLQGSV